MKTALVALFALAFIVSTPATGHAESPWLGVVIADAGSGARILESISDEPADVAGLQSGDVITRVGSLPVTSANGLIAAVKTLRIDSEVTVVYKRGGKAQTVLVTLARKPTENEILERRLIDQVFPRFNMPVLLGDGSGDCDDHYDKVVIFYFFDPGCQTCSSLNAALEVAGSAKDVELIAIDSNWGRFGRTIKHAKKTLPRGATVLGDAGGTFFSEKIKGRGLPVVVVTDRNRFVRYTGLGGAINIKDMRFAVERAVRDDN